MKKYVMCCVFLCAVVYFAALSAVCYAGIDIVASGKGKDKQEAIEAAIRESLMEAINIGLDEEVKGALRQSLYERIFETENKYVEEYDVLVEEKNSARGLYEVKLKVRIDNVNLQATLDETLDKFLEDTRAQRMFQELQFKNRKVIVLYKPLTKNDIPENSKPVQSVLALIEDRLAGYGFRVYLPEKLKEITDYNTELIPNDETAIKIARQEQADFGVVVSFDAGKEDAGDGQAIDIILGTLTIKSFETTTGALFANVQDTAKTYAKEGEYGLLDGLTRVANDIGKKCADRLTKKIVKYCITHPSYVLIIFKNVSLDDQDQIESIMEALNWRYRIARQVGNFLEIEVFNEKSPTKVRRQLSNEIKTAKLRVRQAEMVGQRLTFEGEKTLGF